MAGQAMTRNEAILILNLQEAIEDAEIGDENTLETLDPKEVMERFDTLIEKNQLERGGSFYLQSKIFWAKEQIMQDFPSEDNHSKWNPDGFGTRPIEADEDKAKEDIKDEDAKKQAKKWAISNRKYNSKDVA